jgi:hypothetical protein
MASPVTSFPEYFGPAKKFFPPSKDPPLQFHLPGGRNIAYPPGGETMSLFLTIFEGTTPADARPVVAISDADIIAAVRRLLFERLADKATRKIVQLKPMPEVSREQGTRDHVGRDR